MTGKQLKKMIARAGKTQVGLAREIEIGERTMRKYIASNLAIPRVVELAVRYVCEPIIASGTLRDGMAHEEAVKR